MISMYIAYWQRLYAIVGNWQVVVVRVVFVVGGVVEWKKSGRHERSRREGE